MATRTRQLVLALALTLSANAAEQSIHPVRRVRPDRPVSTATPTPAATITPASTSAPATTSTAAPAATAIAYTLQASDDLQTVLDSYASATVDVTITVPEYYVYNQPLTLRNRATNNWITLQSAYTFDPNVRVSPADAGNMPKLIAPDSNSVIATDPTAPANGQHPGAAHHYRFIGFEITPASGNTMNYALVGFGTYKETDTADLPHDIEIDNCYIHGGDGEMVRGIFMNGGNLIAKSNYISNFKSTFMEANAIYLGNVTSGVQIINNYLEGAAENVCIDCAGTSIQGLTPSNILIQHNYFYKPPEWAQLQPAVFIKNLFECKNCQDVTIDSNVLEHSWMQNQNGHAFVLIPRTQYSAEPWATVQRVTITNNVIRSVAAGINMAGYDDQTTIPTSQRPISGGHTISGNLFTDVSGAKYAGGYFGIGYQIGGPPASVTITNNTTQFAQDDFAAGARPPVGYFLMGTTDLSESVWHNNNLGADVAGDSRYGPGTLASENNPADPQLPYVPVVFDPNNVIGEQSPYWQNLWLQAVPGVLFAPTATTGADLAALGVMETQVKAGIYQ